MVVAVTDYNTGVQVVVGWWVVLVGGWEARTRSSAKVEGVAVTARPRMSLRISLRRGDPEASTSRAPRSAPSLSTSIASTC